VVVIVNTELPVPPEISVTLVGFTVREGLAALLGDIVALKLTAPANPPILVRVIVLLLAEPRVTLIADGFDMIEKFGDGGETTSRMLVSL
jgi:hypothetical protein